MALLVVILTALVALASAQYPGVPHPDGKRTWADGMSDGKCSCRWQGAKVPELTVVRSYEEVRSYSSAVRRGGVQFMAGSTLLLCAGTGTGLPLPVWLVTPCVLLSVLTPEMPVASKRAEFYQRSSYNCDRPIGPAATRELHGSRHNTHA